MSLDGVFIHYLIDELKETLEGGRVSKVNQPFENDLILTIRAKRKNHSLLLSAHQQYARLHLTEETFENPLQAPQFTMVMRKYLNGAILKDIQQLENDRVVLFYFKVYNELGDLQELILALEIMGRHSNILLIDPKANKLLEVIRHIPPSQNSYRSLLPGADFVPAPSQADKLNPFNKEDLEKAEEVLESYDWKSLQKTFQGMGRDTAQELALRLEDASDFQDSASAFLSQEIDPCLYLDGQKSYFTPFPYDLYADYEKESLPSLSNLLDSYYRDKAKRDQVHQKSSDLSHLLKNELDKNLAKLKKQEKEMAQTKNADSYRVKGEVLTAYLHTIEPGMNEVDLPNFYENNEDIKIDLDPQKSPAENAQRLFSRYQKLKNRRTALTSQIEKTKLEIDYLESLISQLELADQEDLEAIRDELVAQGYLKKKNKGQKGRRKPKKSKPEQFQASDGSLILVGKNNQQNDELSMKKASKTDYWLHTKDIPGSHVIIKNDHPSQESLIEAAELAAFYSKARYSSSVPVDYVQVKHLRKPNGAKPGYVIYENQQTLFVTPSAKKVAQLKIKD